MRRIVNLVVCIDMCATFYQKLRHGQLGAARTGCSAIYPVLATACSLLANASAPSGHCNTQAPQATQRA